MMRFRFVTNWGERSCFFFCKKEMEEEEMKEGEQGGVLLVINLIFPMGFPMEISDGKLPSVI